VVVSFAQPGIIANMMTPFESMIGNEWRFDRIVARDRAGQP
jgi:hypothetical protein